jgi:hypothetical protein
MARCFALDNAGSNIAASIAMIAMTTNSSISVNPFDFFNCIFMFVVDPRFLPTGRVRPVFYRPHATILFFTLDRLMDGAGGKTRLAD